MSDMITEVMQEMNISKDAKASTPASCNLFIVNNDSVMLSSYYQEKFHSHVAKLLYIAKRARPDILLAISYLTTRVLCSTQDDWDKLVRVAKYLNSSQDILLTFKSNDELHLACYIDASYGVHADGKSHTGSVMTLGGGAFRCKSGKQKLVSKSSTESELIALSDELSQVIWTRNFLIQQGYNMEEALVFQDNVSTIALALKGRSTNNKMRHIAIRYYFVKDRIESGEVKVVYLCTEDMVADYFTKPLQGELFKKFRAIIMNL